METDLCSDLISLKKQTRCGDGYQITKENKAIKFISFFFFCFVESGLSNSLLSKSIYLKFVYFSEKF